MRSKDETLRTSLIDCAHTMASTQGINAINLRSLAKSAHVSVGTIYNYFKNKDELLIALTQFYWNDLFNMIQKQLAGKTLIEALPIMYRIIKTGIDASLGSLLNSMSSIEVMSTQQLLIMQDDLKSFIIQLIKDDPSIQSKTLFNPFTIDQFAQFIVDYVFIYIRKKDTSMDVFIEIIKRIIANTKD